MPKATRPVVPLTPAQQEVVQANLGLAYKEARRWGNRWHLSGPDQDDLVAVALEALVLAVASRTYQQERGKFSTYAMATIRQKLRRHLWQNRLIRLPEYLQSRQWHEQPLPFLPTVFLAIPSSRNPIEPLAPAEQDMLIVEEDAAEHARLCELVHAAMQRLGELERIVLCWRFGLGGETLSAAEIGRRLGFTRQRAQQIEAKALVKLRQLLGGAGMGVPRPAEPACRDCGAPLTSKRSRGRCWSCYRRAWRLVRQRNLSWEQDD